MGYQKLLVAFDGSEGSLKALEHGIQYAEENGAKLTVLSVVKGHKKTDDIPVRGNPNSTFMAAGNGMYQMAPKDVNARAERMEHVPRMTEEQKQERINAKGEEVLREAKKRLKEEGVLSETAVMEGDAAEEIDRYALSHEADLIVIGHRGLSGLKKLVLGSVSQKVVEKANCPVLVVK
ncbi:MAG TPA: universal stress protein [Bacillales bacterium]|nr:universal stress protein [Bacillales bacterium]